jgi:hypothetical protein
LIAAMENAFSNYPAHDGRFPQVAGITFEVNASMPGIAEARSKALQVG